MSEELKPLIDELYAAEGLAAPHPRHEGKERSLHREGLLLDAAKALEARTPDTSAKVDVERVAKEIMADSFPEAFIAEGMDYIIKQWPARWVEAQRWATIALQSPRSNTSAVELVREMYDGYRIAFDAFRNRSESFALSRIGCIMSDKITKAEQWLKKVGG